MRLRAAFSGLILSLAVIGSASAAGAQADPYLSTPAGGPPSGEVTPPTTIDPEVAGEVVTPAAAESAAPSGSLPVTGGDVTGLVLLGGVAIVGGGLLIGASKRRGHNATD